ncbi:MAG: hypothetical protein H3C30_06060 [Candidatus Hydrogenedentes bacterium]|nr:hypothetical protein [Candidatus Hydrogenedentota bacterium]
MSDEFDKIFHLIEPYFHPKHFSDAVIVLKQELKNKKHSPQYRSSCYYYLGIFYDMIGCGILHTDQKKACIYHDMTEAAFRNALQLNATPETISYLSKILLDQKRNPSEVVSVFNKYKFCYDNINIDAFLIHKLRMLLGTAYCLLSEFENGLLQYRLALGGLVKEEIVEPDLSTFDYYNMYNISLPVFIKSELLALISQFKITNPLAISRLK